MQKVLRPRFTPPGMTAKHIVIIYTSSAMWAIITL